jgi:hypothetical protein
LAKAQFHRHQRVWVEAVGAWATVEKLVPVWAKGFDEPVKITYDVGMGRDFSAAELRSETLDENSGATGEWRLLRARNKWQMEDDCAHHPHPGTFPVVVTDAADWGGWRVPGAEYDRDPHKIERQARLIAIAPRLMAIARDITALIDEAPEDAPPAIQHLARQIDALEAYMNDVPAPPEGGETDMHAAE